MVLYTLLWVNKMDERFKRLFESSDKYSDTGREKSNPVSEFKKGYDESGIKEGALRALSNAGESLDSIAGVPYRTLANELAKASSKDSSLGEYGNAFLSAVKSVGSDPRNAPTGADIAQTMFPNTDDVTARTIASTLYDTQDLTNLIPAAGLMGKIAKDGGMLAGTLKKVSPIKGLETTKPAISAAEALKNAKPSQYGKVAIAPEKGAIQTRESMIGRKAENVGGYDPRMGRDRAALIQEMSNNPELERELVNLIGQEKASKFMQKPFKKSD